MQQLQMEKLERQKHTYKQISMGGDGDYWVFFIFYVPT